MYRRKIKDENKRRNREEMIPDGTRVHAMDGAQGQSVSSGGGLSNLSVKAIWDDTDGFILPYVTILLVVFIGLSVLALDGARYISLQTQLQNGADEIALAGAAELDGSPSAITRADNALTNATNDANFRASTLFGTGAN